MRASRCLLALALAATGPLLVSCGPSARPVSQVHFDSIVFAGSRNQVVVHFEAGMNPLLKSNCTASAYYHVDAFESQVFPVVQSAVGALLPSPGRLDVWVFESAQGVVGAGGPELRPGRGGTLPNLCTLLARAYYPNVPAYQVTIPGLPQAGLSFWDYVASVTASVMRLVDFLFGSP